MQNKISVNVTDMFQYRQRSKQKSYSFDLDRRSGLVEGSAQDNQRKYSEVPMIRDQCGFLSKIRVSGGKDRYRKHSKMNYADKRHNSMEATSLNVNHNNSSKCQTLQSNQHTKSKPANNYSPFFSKQDPHTIQPLTQKKPKKPKKLHFPHYETPNQTPHKPPQQSQIQQKIYAKLLQFTTEFDKTKLFEPQQQQLSLKQKQQKLSPYQLSIRRKNLHLIKMKLNSLGEKADDQEKNVCMELSKLCEERDEREWRKGKLWRMRRKDQEAFGNKRDIWPKKYGVRVGSTKEWGQWSLDVRHPENKFGLNTKTIQIKQIPKTKRSILQHKCPTHNKNTSNRYQ